MVRAGLYFFVTSSEATNEVKPLPIEAGKIWGIALTIL